MSQQTEQRRCSHPSFIWLDEDIGMAECNECGTTILIAEGRDALDLWWELSYAQYLTIPRSVMQEMPDKWQGKMAALLSELDTAFKWRPKEGRYWCHLRDARGRMLSDPLAEYRHGNEAARKLKSQ